MHLSVYLCVELIFVVDIFTPFQINKEFLVRELKKTDPFAGPEPELPFPRARISFKKMPRWLATEKSKRLINQGRINEIREEYR